MGYSSSSSILLVFTSSLVKENGIDLLIVKFIWRENKKLSPWQGIQPSLVITHTYWKPPAQIWSFKIYETV